MEEYLLDEKGLLVKIVLVSGQSFTADVIFKAKILSNYGKDIIQMITPFLELNDWDEGVFLGCDITELREILMYEFGKKSIKVLNKELKAGLNFGYNLFVEKYIEPSLKEFTQQRNKLNREISTLKKATLKN